MLDIKLLGILLTIIVAFAGGQKAPSNTRPSFTLVVIPDTQKLTADEELGDPQEPELLYHRMKAMAQWIADQKDSLNIVMVAHLGDMTEDQDVEIQWQRNVETWKVLSEADIPFVPCQGNHDSIPSLNQFFPINNFVDKPYWFSGEIMDGTWVKNAVGQSQPYGRKPQELR